MNASRGPWAILLLVLGFFYAPILVLVLYSFNDSKFGGAWVGFSLRWYTRLAQDREVWAALSKTFWIAGTATLTAAILGTSAALALHRYRTRLQKVHYGLIYVPLVLPEILTGISLLLFFVASGLRLGLFSIYLAHVSFCVSYVAMVVLARLQDFDFSVIEAARDLGADWWTVTWRVLLPLLAPGIGAGALLAFTLSVDDFIISNFVAGPGATTLPIYIYSSIKAGSPPMINALSTLLLIITSLAVWFSQRLLRQRN